MVGYVSVPVPVPDDGFIERLNLVARFGQRKVLCGLMVHLCVYYRSTGQTSSEYFLVCIFWCLINKHKFGWLVLITAVWNSMLGVYAIFSIHRN